MREEMGKKTRGWARTVQGVICLFLILSGMSICMEGLLSISIPWQARLIAAAALAVISAFMQRGWKWILAEVLVFAGGMFLFCVKYQGILLIGMKEVANQALELFNAYNRTEYLLWYLDTQESYGWLALLCIFALLGFLESLLLMSTRNIRCHFLITAVLPVLIIAAGLMVGWAALFAGILLMFAGILLETLDLRERGNVLLGGAVAVSIGIPILLVGNGTLWEQIELWHTDWYQRQLKLEDQMLAWIEELSHISLFSSEQMQYTLENDSPRFSGREIFKITVDYPISSPLYIRGFVGGAYEDGKWKRISRQEFSDWAKQQGGDEETYAEIVQSYPYDFLSLSPMFYSVLGKEKHVSLKLAQELEGYTLMPYFTKVTDEQTFLADGIYPPGEETQFEWDSYMGLSDYDRDLASSIFMESFFGDFFGGPKITRANQVFTAYQKYAREQYTRLPGEGLYKLKDYVQQYQKTHPSYREQYDAIMDKFRVDGGTNEWSYSIGELDQILTEEEIEVFTTMEMQYNINAILKMLWEDNEYSLDLEEVPKGEDSVEYFLFEQHKGYCAHFATAATLLFRMNDIPARYASGYLVVPSDFKRNKDGTWTASVTDERAHAWTEIFFENLGFTPIETTPPEYTERLENMEEGENLTQAVRKMEEERQEQQQKQEEQKKQEEEKQEEEQKKQEEEQKQEEQKKQAEEQKGQAGQEEHRAGAAGSPGSYGNGSLWRTLGTAAAVLAGISMVCLVLRLRRRWALRDRQRRFACEERTCAVREIGRELGKILRLMGIKRQNEMGDREYQDLLGQKLPQMDWNRIFFIFQKAEFSQHGVTEEEYKEILSKYQELEQKLVSAGGIRGWYLRCIKIYS